MDSSKPGTQTLLKAIILLLAASLALISFQSMWTCPDKTLTVVTEIRNRRNFHTYEEYVAQQLKKTLNPRLREVWKSRDWDRKIKVFKQVFERLKEERILKEGMKALCIGARVGQEVVALRQAGLGDSVGIDLVESGDGLVIKGDMHRHPFDNSTFDMEFSNAFDHSLLPSRFAEEIERTVRPGGVVVLHVALHTRGDKYTANDIVGGRAESVVQLFSKCSLVHVRDVDAFGLDTEIVLRRN